MKASFQIVRSAIEEQHGACDVLRISGKVARIDIDKQSDVLHEMGNVPLFDRPFAQKASQEESEPLVPSSLLEKRYLNFVPFGMNVARVIRETSRTLLLGIESFEER